MTSGLAGAGARGGPAPVRFGFVGAGWIAQRALAPAVHAADGAVLQAVAARDAARAASLEPAGRSYDDYAALIADDTVDVVYINLSNEAHLPWTLAALKAGKHVLCEKPLGLDAAQVAEMAAVATAADRLLVEALWYRWHPRARRLDELIRRGLLGEIRSVEAEFSFQGGAEGRMQGNYRLDPARGGGALYDVGCYTVSAAHLALGPALRVQRVERAFTASGVDAATTAWLQPDPATGSDLEPRTAVIRCGIDRPDRQVLRVIGDQAGAEFTVGEAFMAWRQPSRLELTSATAAIHREDFPPVDAYQLMVEAVAARVRGEDAFLVDLDHSAEVATTLGLIRAWPVS